MNTEKLEKLKKSLDNKFIPDSMKDKIRTEIQKLESEIKEKEITSTEIKEEVKNIQEKVEDALEVAEKKEENEEESKVKTTKKVTTKTKKTAMALAKEIRKEGESWTDAVKRAGKEMKGIKEDVKKETKSEIAKLKSLIRKRKDLKGVSNSNLLRDGHRKALPMGKRTSATGHTYYENRRNRTDKGKVGELYLENGGNIDYKHNYMMLSRLQMDCEYYLNYGNRNEKVLWAGNVDEQIEEMKRLWNSFPKDKKPEWLTMNQILDYEKQMKNSYADGGAIPNNYEGKTPEQVWNMFTTSQKYHFLLDHNKEIESTPRSIEDNTKKSYKFLPTKVKVSFKKHIETGEYANGGMMSNISVHDGTDFMNTPVYYRGGAMAFEDGGDFMSGAYAENGAEIYRKKANEYQKEKEKSMVFKKYRVNVYEDSYPFVEPHFTDNFVEAVNFAKKTINQQKQYRPMSEDLFTTIDKFTPIDKRMNVIYPYYEMARFNEKDLTESKFEDGGDFMSGVYAEEGAMVNKDGIKVQSITKPEKELTEAEWLAKHNESREARTYEEGGNLPSYLKDKESVMFEKGKNVIIDERNYNESLGMTTLFDVYVNGLKAGKVQYDIEHEDFTAFSSKGFTGNTRFSLKEFDNKDEAIKYIVDNTPKSFAVGGGIFADTFTGETGTHYTGLVGETNAMSSGEMFMSGGRVRRTKAQMTRDRENKDIDAYNWYIVDLELNKAISGNEYKEDAIDELSDFDGDKRYKVVSKKTLKSLGIENPNERFKSYEVGGGVGQKKYNIKFNVGKAKYVINSYDGVKKHKDGSEFYDIDIFKTKKDFDDYQRKLIKEGYKYSYEDGGDLFENYDEQPEELAEIVNFYMEKFDEGDYDYEDSQNFLKEVEAIGYTFDYGLDNEPYGLRPIGTELDEYADGGAIANQQLIADAHLRPAEMFGREGIPAYKRGGRIKYNNGGEYSQYGKFIASQIEYLISLKTIASKKEPIQNLLKNMDDYRGTEIEKRITTDNLKYALQQKTVSKMNEVLRISLNALKD